MSELMNIKQKVITGMMIILALLLWSSSQAYADITYADITLCPASGYTKKDCFCGGLSGITCHPGEACITIGNSHSCQKDPFSSLEQNANAAINTQKSTLSASTLSGCPWNVKINQKCTCGLMNNYTCSAGQYCINGDPFICSDVPPCPSYGTAASESCYCLGSTCSAGQYCTSPAGCVDELPKQTTTGDGNDECLPINYYSSYEGCLFCPLFRVVFNAASQMTKLSIDKLSSPIYHLVILAFALWIALEVLKLVSSPETKDLKDFFAATINKSFVVLLVVIVLQNGAHDFMKLGLDPVFSTGMKIAEETLTPQKMSNTGKDKTDAVTCEDDSELTKDGALPNNMGNSIMCIMRLVQNSAAKVAAIGSATMCESFASGRTTMGIIPHFGLLLTGLGFWIGAMLILIGVPWMMLDCVVQLAVAGMMLPAAIGFYAFKPTRRYTKPVWNSFLSTMFNFLFTSLVVMMLIAAFDVIMDETAGNDISQYVLSNDFDFDDFLDKIGWFSMPFLKIVFVLLLIWAMMPEAAAFADNFADGMMQTSSDGGKPNIGSQIGTMGASLTKSVFQKTALPIGKAGTKVAWGWTKGAARGTVHGVRRAVTWNQKRRTKKYGTATTNEDGSTTYTRTTSRWFGLGGTRTTSYTVGGNGDETLSVTTKYKKLGIRGLQDVETTKQKSDNYTISTKKVRNRKTGQMEVVEDGKIRYNSSNPKSLLNHKGEINNEEFDKLMNSGDDKVKLATLKTIMQQRLQGRNDIVNNSKSIKNELLRDKNGKVIGYREYLSNGKVRDMHFSISGKRIKTDFTELDAKGNGVRLSSDGVINRKQTFKAQIQRDENGNITSINPDEKSVKSTYGLTDYYETYRQQHRFKKIDYQNSMFSQSEIKKAQKFMAGNNQWQTANMYEFRK